MNTNLYLYKTTANGFFILYNKENNTYIRLKAFGDDKLRTIRTILDIPYSNYIEVEKTFHMKLHAAKLTGRKYFNHIKDN